MLEPAGSIASLASSPPESPDKNRFMNRTFISPERSVLSRGTSLGNVAPCNNEEAIADELLTRPKGSLIRGRSLQSYNPPVAEEAPAELVSSPLPAPRPFDLNKVVKRGTLKRLQKARTEGSLFQQRRRSGLFETSRAGEGWDVAEEGLERAVCVHVREASEEEDSGEEESDLLAEVTETLDAKLRLLLDPHYQSSTASKSRTESPQLRQVAVVQPVSKVNSSPVQRKRSEQVLCRSSVQQQPRASRSHSIGMTAHDDYESRLVIRETDMDMPRTTTQLRRGSPFVDKKPGSKAKPSQPAKRLSRTDSLTKKEKQDENVRIQQNSSNNNQDLKGLSLKERKTLANKHQRRVIRR